MNDVFVHHQVVSSLQQCIEAEINFCLACCCYFMVVAFNAQSGFFKQAAHFAAQILLLIRWSYRNITAFYRDFISKVAAFFSASCVPNRLLGIYRIKGFVHAALITYIIENKELGFRSEKCCCTYTTILQVFFCTNCDTARISFISVTVRREDIAKYVQRRMCSKWIDIHCTVIRHHNHIGFFNTTEPGNRRTVECYTIYESILIHFFSRERNVMGTSR
ncbi:hypothetical protein D3C76_982800 [compost metagenome]